MVVFGRYQLFPRLRLLLRDGGRLELGDRAFDVLVQLVGAAGQVVSKDVLLSKIWPKEVVEENSLQAQISSLRKTFGNDRHLISTDFGRGYRFTIAVQFHHAVTSSIGTCQVRSGLPRPKSPLIGRTEELLELNRLLTIQRLLTLAGPAGVGKTRLAIEIASGASPYFTDGIFFADLSKIGSEASVSPAISSALAGLAGTMTQLVSHPSRALLVVDNCEHVVSACAEVIEQFLEADPKLSILLTSQTPLGLDGEQVYRVQPLTLPLNSINVENVTNYSAIELFVQRVISADQWLMGNTNKARRAAQHAIDEAIALDHACTLCCALLEGSCTVAALAGDVKEVERVSQQVIQVAANHGLNFWGLYGSVFALWARVFQKDDEISFVELSSALATLQAHGFDPAYSVFLSDFANMMIEQGYSRTAAKLIKARLADGEATGQLWNWPELIRIKERALLNISSSPESDMEI